MISEELKKARFFVFQHKSMNNENLIVTSLAHVTGVSDGIIVFWSVKQEEKHPTRMALPFSAIKGALAIPDADLEASLPRNKKPSNGKIRVATDYEYFTEQVMPFLQKQDIQSFYSANKA